MPLRGMSRASTTLKKKKFYDLEAKGLVLGISQDFDYSQYEQHMDEGDMIVLFLTASPNAVPKTVS